MATRSRFARLWAHLWNGGWQLRRAFPPTVLDAIEAQITAGELHHGAELRFVVESRLAPRAVWARIGPRERAMALFAELGVWDTADNNGVLIYVLLADRAVEIVADRGARAQVPAEIWDRACAIMVDAFRAADFAGGSRRAIELLDQALSRVFPPMLHNPDELPNRPLVR